MSYRIHLNIGPKDQIKKYLYKTPADESIYLAGNQIRNGITLELDDELPIEHLKKIAKFKDAEYCPYSLTKNDILEIIFFYRKKQFDLATKEIEKLSKIKDDIEAGRLSDALGPVCSFIMYENLNNENLRNYFKEIESKELVKEEGRFLLDYFYLVRLYDNFSSKSDMAVITHG